MSGPKDLELALELADMADVVTLQHFRQRDLVVDSKPDMTFVSEADRNAEQHLRDHLKHLRPDDGIVGEEHGTIDGSSGARWVIDPIDGTHNYVRSIPVWATLIAVERDGTVDVGVVSAPSSPAASASASPRSAGSRTPSSPAAGTR